MLKKFTAMLMSVVIFNASCCFTVYAEETEQPVVLTADETASGSSVVDTTVDFRKLDKKLVVVMDTSGSMYGGNEIEAISSTKEYVSKLFEKYNNKVAVALVSFESYAELELDFTTDYLKFTKTLDNLDFDGVTNMDDAFSFTNDYLKNSPKVNDTEILFVTDGIPCDGSQLEPSKFINFVDKDVSLSDIKYAEYVYYYVKNCLDKKWTVKTVGVYDGIEINSDEYNFIKTFLSAISNPPGNSNLIIDGEVIIGTITEENIETTTEHSGGNSSNKAVVDKLKEEPETQNTQSIQENTDIYEYGELSGFPLIETYNVNDTDSAVAAINDMINLIDQKQYDVEKDEVNLEMINFIEEAIALSASKTLADDSALDESTINELKAKADATKTEVEALLKSKNIELINPLLTNINIVTDSTVKIDSNVKNLSVDNINVIVGDGNGSIIIGKDFINENISDEDIIISLSVDGAEEGESDNTDISDDVNEVAASNDIPACTLTTNIKNFNKPITCSLRLISNVAPTYQGVNGPDGLVVSKPNNSTRKIMFRATSNGTYTVKNVTSLDFTDINALNAVQKDTLRKLYAHGLIEGKTKTSFAPTTTLTRAEFTTLLIKTMGEYDPNYNGTSGFSDMKNQWSAPVIAKAKKLGIIAGYSSDNTFRPDNKLNNEQLYHLLGLVYTKNNKKATANIEAQLSKLKDNATIATWARKNTAVSLQYGIYVPREDNTFASRNEVTRFNAAIAMGNLFEKAQFTGGWN